MSTENKYICDICGGECTKIYISNKKAYCEQCWEDNVLNADSIRFKLGSLLDEEEDD